MNNDMKKLSQEEAEKLQAELTKAYPGKVFRFNPNVVKIKPLVYEIESVLETAIKRLSDAQNQNDNVDLAKVQIIFPVSEPQNTKKNRVRLMRDDPKSPLGKVIRENTPERDLFALMKYKPYAPAIFYARDVVAWASVRMAEKEMAAA